MKILENDQKKGEITLRVEDLNDLWTLYNVLSKGDIATARTTRRVVIKEGTQGTRKPMVLTLKVEDIAFHEFSNRLRVKGTIIEGPDELVSYGTYHTFNVEPGQKLTIKKEIWLKNELNRLKKSSKFKSNFIMIIIAIETGLATISQITNFSHKRISTIKKNIPGKRYEQTHRNKALEDFFSDIRRILEENLKNIEINLIIICGPGNTRDLFIKYLKEKGASSYLPKIKSIHASSGTESAILESLKSKELVDLKEKVKIFQETEKIQEIFKLLSTHDEMIKIGFKEINEVAEKGSIKDLFIADTLIRGTSKEHKLKIEKLINNVEYAGGKIYILNSEQPTGKQIVDLGSLVAILRYIE
ncbi:MAG: mRNA surveillance protein pelota [Promethearchaeota archaeon]